MLVIYLVHTDNERNSEMALVVELECLHQYFLSRSLKHIFSNNLMLTVIRPIVSGRDKVGSPTSFRTYFC